MTRHDATVGGDVAGSMSDTPGKLAQKVLPCDFCEEGIQPGERYGIGPGCYFHLWDCFQ